MLRKGDKRGMETLQMRVCRSAIRVTLRYRINICERGELGNKQFS
jgi:hypothetical protein